MGESTPHFHASTQWVLAAGPLAQRDVGATSAAVAWRVAATHTRAIASAIYQLNQGESTQTAKKGIGPFFMHAPIGNFLNLYPDNTKNFADWVINDFPNAYADYQSSN